MIKNERPKRSYTFHDPNPPGVLAEQAIKVFVEVQKPRAEEAIRKAMQEPSAAGAEKNARTVNGQPNVNARPR